MNKKLWGGVFIILNMLIYPHIAFSEDHFGKLLKINTKWEEKSKKVYKYNYIIKAGRIP